MKLFKKVKEWFSKKPSDCIEEIKERFYVLEVTESQLNSLNKGYVPVALKEDIKLLLDMINNRYGD